MVQYINVVDTTGGHICFHMCSKMKTSTWCANMCHVCICMRNLVFSLQSLSALSHSHRGWSYHLAASGISVFIYLSRLALWENLVDLASSLVPHSGINDSDVIVQSCVCHYTQASQVAEKEIKHVHTRPLFFHLIEESLQMELGNNLFSFCVTFAPIEISFFTQI